MSRPSETPDVYTYYERVPNLWPEDTQLALIELWKKSWAKHGWNPVVLNESAAAPHKFFKEYKERVGALPTAFGYEYTVACFMRWLAVGVKGGGMMVDYDVINYGFGPRQPARNRVVIFSDRTQPLSMGAVLGVDRYYMMMVRLFSEWVPDKRDRSVWGEGLHCDDQTYLQQCLDRKNRKGPTWLAWENGCTRFPNTDGPLVHYGYEMRAAGLWPKCDFVEKVRPI